MIKIAKKKTKKLESRFDINGNYFGPETRIIIERIGYDEYSPTKLNSPKSVDNLIGDYMRNQRTENMCTLALNLDCELLGRPEIYKSGYREQVYSNYNEMLLLARNYNASAITIIHNHPDQRIPRESDDDKFFLARLLSASKNFNIKIKDFIIFGLEEYISLHERCNSFYSSYDKYYADSSNKAASKNS